MPDSSGGEATATARSMVFRVTTAVSQAWDAEYARGRSRACYESVGGSASFRVLAASPR